MNSPSPGWLLPALAVISPAAAWLFATTVSRRAAARAMPPQATAPEPAVTPAPPRAPSAGLLAPADRALLARYQTALAKTTPAVIRRGRRFADICRLANPAAGDTELGVVLVDVIRLLLAYRDAYEGRADMAVTCTLNDLSVAALDLTELARREHAL